MNKHSIEENQHFRLFANCIPVKGKKRSIICDLQRLRFDFIPNDFYDFLQEYNGTKILELRKDFDEESQKIITEYFTFLIEKNYIFFCEEVEVDWFPPLDIIWDSPAIIENAIVDINKQSQHDFKNIILQLEDLACRAVEFRFFCEYTLKELEDILLIIKNKLIERINIVVPFTSSFTPNSVEQLLKKFPRIQSFIIHSFPANKDNNIDQLNKSASEKIEYTEQLIDSSAHCGFISPRYFRLNIESFSESKLYNNCLNKKIAIDVDGKIKNCPAMPTDYGNIKSVGLRSALSNKEFKKQWNITKDQIEVCKTCEFRYICSDCRTFLKNDKNPLSKPLKCSYNPDTMIWEDAILTKTLLR